MTGHEEVELSSEGLTIRGVGGKWSAIAVAVGIVGVLAGAGAAVWSGDWDRFWHGYLVAFLYWLSIALGGLFFVLILHLTRGGWGVSLRRVAEAVAGNVLFPLPLLVVPVLVALPRLYPWADAGYVEAHPLVAAKAPWLNAGFFYARCAVYFTLWGCAAWWFHRRSLEQDVSRKASLTVRMEKVSAVFTVVYALSVTLFAFDFIMSLDPEWFSTIFGVYFFAGSFLGYLAFKPALTGLLQRAGRMRRAVTIEHYHDMGKLIFAFVVFWAYIGFSQYMLIWYANLPEETGWFHKRQTGGWTAISLILLVGHFVLPFLALLSRIPKRRPAMLLVPAAWVLVMHWIDVYWLVFPELEGASPVPALSDVALFVGVGGITVATVFWRLGRGAVVPVGDPRLKESLGFENA